MSILKSQANFSLKVLNKRSNQNYLSPRMLNTRNFGSLPSFSLSLFEASAHHARHPHLKVCLKQEENLPIATYSQLIKKWFGIASLLSSHCYGIQTSQFGEKEALLDGCFLGNGLRMLSAFC